MTVAGSPQTIPESLNIESPYFNPFGAPIVIASADGAIAIAATYTQGTIVWTGTQVTGPITGTLGTASVAGTLGLTTSETENLVTGKTTDSGTIQFSGMTPSSLNANGLYSGTSTIPQNPSVPPGQTNPYDCSTLTSIPGTCTETGFQSSGKFTAGLVSGSYTTIWSTPALEFTASITGTFTPATTSTSVSCTAASFAVSATSTCKATVSGAFGSISGETVTFSQTGAGSVALPSATSCTLSGNTCSVTVTGASPGSVTVAASYGGDSENAGSSGTSALSVTYKSCPQVPNSGNVNLSGDNLQYCNLAGYNLSGDNLQYANLQHADLQNANLLGANLAYANLSGATATGANLLGANLQYTILEGVNFASAIFTGAAMQFANMSNGDFNYANFSGAATYGVNVSGATFVGATSAP